VDIIVLESLQQAKRMAQDYLSVSLAGAKMTRQAASDLEQKLLVNPDDELSRIALMGYYPRRGIGHREDREKSMNHELWFVRNCPRHEAIRFPHCSLLACRDRDLYELGRSAWLVHVHEDCEDVAILANATAFFSLWDNEFAIQLIERARKIEPANKQLLRDLSNIYYRDLTRKPDEEWLQRAYEVHKELVEAEPNTPKHVIKFANVALKCGDIDCARNTALGLLRDHLAASASVLHEAHSILGRIYLKEGNIQEARAELLASGARAEYDLDNEFIAVGESPIVCEHLWRSLPSWKTGRIQLLLWILQLRLGGKPKLKATWLLSHGIGGYIKDR
jgi:tetratricopeptide (TPR) repeat protein